MARSKSTAAQDAIPWTLVYILRGTVAIIALIITLISWMINRIDRSEIHSYTDPKEHKDRMLGAIVPSGSDAWFFKLSGDKNAVAIERESFLELIESVTFDDPLSSPKWKLPKGWKRLPDDAPENTSGMFKRFATLTIPSGDEHLEVTVTHLPMPEDDSDEFMLANFNRWRGQLQLTPIDVRQLKKTTLKIPLEGTEATFVDILGTAAQQGMAAPRARSTPVAERSRGDSPDPVDPTFKVPDGWMRSSGVPFSKFSFEVTDGGQNALVTVSPLQDSELLANVNRWRAQLGLGSIMQKELDEQVKRIKLGDVTAKYLQVEGETQTILVVIAVNEGTTWFIKLKGDRELAEKQKEKFEEFVKSFRFEKDSGESNGD